MKNSKNCLLYQAAFALVLFGCRPEVLPPTEISRVDVGYRQVVRINQGITKTSNPLVKKLKLDAVIGVRTQSTWSDNSQAQGPTAECVASSPDFGCNHYTITVRELVDSLGGLRERNDIPVDITSSCELKLRAPLSSDVKKVRIYTVTHFNGTDPCKKGFTFSVYGPQSEMQEIENSSDYGANSTSEF